MKLKKSLGQHFLHDEYILEKIVEAYVSHPTPACLLEIGGGAGALTTHLFRLPNKKLKVVEIDKEKCGVLAKKFKGVDLLQEDVLRLGLPFDEPFWVVGNFPYYISTQIVFKILEWKTLAQGMIGMFQKEVAQRICSPHGSKQYGILSVLVQSYFDVRYLFDVPPSSFTPPPKVISGVIQFSPKKNPFLGDEKTLQKITKAGFNQRRKMLRNSLQSLFPPDLLQQPLFSKRPEQLSMEEFHSLCTLISD